MMVVMMMTIVKTTSSIMWMKGLWKSVVQETLCARAVWETVWSDRCDCWAEHSDEYEALVEARQRVIDLLQHVNDEVREQENWRKTLDMYWQLDKRLTEHATHSVLVELRVR